MVCNLLPELQEKIFHYLTIDDVKNLACCSSQNNLALKRYLWKSVQIQREQLLNEDKCFANKLQSLRHTKSFTLLININYKEEWEKKLIKVKLKRIVQHCNPLAVRGWSATYHILKDAAKAANVRKLDLSKSDVNDRDLQAICKYCQSLRVLNLKETKVSDTGLVHIKNLPFIEDLNMRYCDIFDAGLESLNTVKTIRRLDFGYCKEITDEGFSCISQLRRVEKLSLPSCRIKDPTINVFKTLVNLGELDLSRCYCIEGRGLSSLLGLVRLSRLSLYSCGISDAVLVTISDMKNLRHLDLGKTLVTDSGMKDVAKLEKLKELVISYCDVSDEGIEILLYGLKGLRKLDVYGSRVSPHYVNILRKLGMDVLWGVQMVDWR